nr:hypothetical protein CFP56_09578 [Quercus suber]
MHSTIVLNTGSNLQAVDEASFAMDDAKLRKRAQNRIAQRRHRAKRRASKLQDPTDGPKDPTDGPKDPSPQSSPLVEGQSLAKSQSPMLPTSLASSPVLLVGSTNMFHTTATGQLAGFTEVLHTQKDSALPGLHADPLYLPYSSIVGSSSRCNQPSDSPINPCRAAVQGSAAEDPPAKEQCYDLADSDLFDTITEWHDCSKLQ